MANRLINIVKAVRNIVTGQSMSSVSFYFSGVGTILSRNIPRSTVQCIMCGFPRTGTHWIRNVIEKSTGIKTCDLSWNKPAPGTPKVLLVKVHARNKAVARVKALLTLPPHRFMGNYIYVYRDPRDSIISMYEMFRERKQLHHMTPEAFIQKYDPIGQYRWEINAWVLRRHRNVLLVRFEDMKSDPLRSFRRIFDYLGLEEQVEKTAISEKVACDDQKNRPRGKAFGWRNTSEEYRWLVAEITRQLKREIRLLGYDPHV